MRRALVAVLVLGLLAIEAKAVEMYELHFIGVQASPQAPRHVVVLVYSQASHNAGTFGPMSQSTATSSQFLVRLSEADALELADRLTAWAEGGADPSIFDKVITTR